MLRSARVRIGTIALSLAGLGIWFSQTDEPTPENHQRNSAPTSLTSFFLSNSGNNTESEQAKSASLLTQNPTHNAPIVKDSSNESCISTLFLSRSHQKGITPDEKFSNLRWAIEQFPGETMPAIFDKAAAELGIPKAKLIADLRNAAIDVFQSTQTSGHKTDIDRLNYWNNLKIAHRYAGLTDMGDFNPALSTATVSYDESTLIRNRDAYAINGAREIFKSIEKELKDISDHYPTGMKNGPSKGKSLDEALENLTPEQRIKLREQVDIIIYATDTIMSQDSESYLKIGIDENSYDLLARIKRTYLLDQKINDDFAKECKNYSYAPK